MTIKSIYFAILVHILSTVHSTEVAVDPPKGPGKSGCSVWGQYEFNCNISDIPIENLPKECTSFLYDGIRLDTKHDLVDPSTNTLGIKGYLNKLILTKKKVFVYFGHTDEMEWIKVLSSDDIETVAQSDMDSLKIYLNNHKGISGLIFLYLVRHELYEYTINLKKYIGVMRTTFPTLEIGMNVDCVAPIFYTNHPKSNWLDFSMLNSSFDFYLLKLYDTGMNNCTQQFENTGVFPLTGDTKTMNTIDIITVYAQSVMKVPKSKLYYGYQLSGTAEDVNDDFCTTYYPYICKQKIKTKDHKLCADTQKSFFDKGKYAYECGEGFVTGTIDIDDAYGTCECGHSFPAFYALLNGFNGRSPPVDCSLFDRTEN